MARTPCTLRPCNTEQRRQRGTIHKLLVFLILFFFQASTSLPGRAIPLSEYIVVDMACRTLICWLLQFWCHQHNGQTFPLPPIHCVQRCLFQNKYFVIYRLRQALNTYQTMFMSLSFLSDAGQKERSQPTMLHVSGSEKSFWSTIARRRWPRKRHDKPSANSNCKDNESATW